MNCDNYLSPKATLDYSREPLQSSNEPVYKCGLCSLKVNAPLQGNIPYIL